jgi:hypothetical protein
MTGGPDWVVKLLRRIIDYTPDTGGGIAGRAEDDRAVEYYQLARKQGALGTLTVNQKERLLRHVLGGATISTSPAAGRASSTASRPPPERPGQAGSVQVAPAGRRPFQPGRCQAALAATTAPA